jgi:1-acyl-sn-glycerol-3-phosphate acyltransferase
LLYSFIKIIVRLALKIFCARTIIKGESALQIRGPVLITANHPNSFLDAVIIGSRFDRPVHFLARGDAFRKPWHNRLLRLLNMIPVYRLSEGKENLSLNDSSFRRSKEILDAGGIVLIFIEGICVHKHELQPFKKGAARIAMESRANKKLHILPLVSLTILLNILVNTSTYILANHYCRKRFFHLKKTRRTSEILMKFCMKRSVSLSRFPEVKIKRVKKFFFSLQ